LLLAMSRVSRRARAAAKLRNASATCRWAFARATIGETDCTRSRMTRHIKRYRSTGIFDRVCRCTSRCVAGPRPSIPKIRCPSRVMHLRVPWRGVPLPGGSSFRSLADALVLPSDLRVSDAHGICCSSQVCSRLRVIGHLWTIGPTCRFSFSVRPIDFRRADFTARQIKMRASNSSGKSWRI